MQRSKSKLLDSKGKMLWEGITSIALINKRMTEFVKSNYFKALKDASKQSSK